VAMQFQILHLLIHPRQAQLHFVEFGEAGMG